MSILIEPPAFPMHLATFQSLLPRKPTVAAPPARTPPRAGRPAAFARPPALDFSHLIPAPEPAPAPVARTPASTPAERRELRARSFALRLLAADATARGEAFEEASLVAAPRQQTKRVSGDDLLRVARRMGLAR